MSICPSSAKRLDMFSGTVPTVVEQGLQKTYVPIWFAVLAPAGLPESLRDRIAGDLKDVMAMPDIRSRMSEIGMEPNWTSAGDLGNLIRSESASLGPLIKALGIRID